MHLYRILFQKTLAGQISKPLAGGDEGHVFHPGKSLALALKVLADRTHCEASRVAAKLRAVRTMAFPLLALYHAGTCVRPEKNQLNNDESAGIHDIFLAEQSLNQGDDERSCIAVYDVDLLHDIQFKRQEGAKLEWKKILTNVNLIAIVAGALLYLLHISLPTPIVSTLSSVGAMIGPMGMLLAGMAIAEVPLKKVFCTSRNYLPVALRLIVVPIIVLLLLRVFHASDWIADGKAILMTVYLSAITPSCATVTSMAQLYNRDAAHSSALYVLSTLLSIMTMPLMIGLFDMLV